MGIRIPLIGIGDQGIPNITVNGTGIPFVQPVSSGIRPIGQLRNVQIADTRVWLNGVPTVTPIEPPVVINAGTPIVFMPGCVEVHKENAKKDPSRNKMLVNDDPKGMTTLCDAGMPNYYPPDYDYRELSWQTVYMDQEQEPEGINTEAPEAPVPETPSPPPTETPEGDPECPGPLSPRIGSVGPNEKEKVVGHELQPDPNNLNKKICVALYEDIGIVEQYLPSPQIVTTTAVIASVAASSALLAKPLADLLLKVVKPVVKKVIGKVNAILGKSPYRMTDSEKKTNEYRVKKGLLPIPFAKNHQKKMKAEKKAEKEKKKTQS